MTYPFDLDTYVVLDLPEPVAGQVMAIRRKNLDAFRAALPAEITVAGSGGVGCFAEDEDPDRAWQILADIAASTPPIHASFGEVMRFPNTDLFVLRLIDEEPIRAFHERIAGSGIRFDSSRFPYTPHGTLRGRSPVTDDDVEALFTERISDRFTLDRLSVYRLELHPSPVVPVICTLIRRWALTG